MSDIDLRPQAFIATPEPKNLTLTVRGAAFEFSPQVLHHIGPWIGLLALEDDRIDALLKQMDLEIKDARGEIVWPR